MLARFHRLVWDRRGGTAVEYGLIVALVVIVILAALHNLANRTTGIWNDVANKVTTA